jgi:hypothetical protein
MRIRPDLSMARRRARICALNARRDFIENQGKRNAWDRALYRMSGF